MLEGEWLKEAEDIGQINNQEGEDDVYWGG